MTDTNKSAEMVAVALGDLLDAGVGAMVTLVAGETQLVAHRAVLVARSPVFDAMFRHDTLEASSGTVSITDVDGPVLRQLLTYVYTQQVPQLPDTAAQLLPAADKYGLLELKTWCEQQLEAQLATENAAATAVLAVRHCCHSLKEAAVSFIKNNSQVMATQGWADAMRGHTEDLIEVSRLLAGPPPKTSSTASKRRRLDAGAGPSGNRTAIAAAPAVAPRRIRPPNDVVLSYYLSLSGAEKTRKMVEAAREGSVKELYALLAAGADEGAREYEHSRLTALHLAARGGHVEAVRCLVEAGAEVDATSAEGNASGTPLHQAAYNGHTDVVRLLMESSADPNARDKAGNTPLRWAKTGRRAEAAAVLIEAGADPGAGDTFG